MVFIGNIQDIGKPYVDLYLDKEKNALFLFVRVSSPAEASSRYAAISVTQIKLWIIWRARSQSLISSPPVIFNMPS